MKHEGSVHRQQVKLQNDAFADGVCHAIDEVRAIAEAARLGGDAAGADGRQPPRRSAGEEPVRGRGRRSMADNVARSARREVRNPLLSLPATKRLMELPATQRALISELVAEIANDARVRAQQSWTKNKGPMAAYWKAVGAYAGHLKRVLRSAA